MDQLSVLNTLKEIICQVTGLAPEELDEDVSLVREIGISSLEMMMIQSRLEKHFKITLSVRDLRTVSSIRDYAEMICSHQRAGNAG